MSMSKSSPRSMRSDGTSSEAIDTVLRPVLSTVAPMPNKYRNREIRVTEDPRTGLPVVPIPDSLHENFGFLSAGIIHFIETVGRRTFRNGQLSSKDVERILLITSNCIFLCTPEAATTRCIPICRVGGILLDRKRRSLAICAENQHDLLLHVRESQTASICEVLQRTYRALVGSDLGVTSLAEIDAAVATSRLNLDKPVRGYRLAVQNVPSIIDILALDNAGGHSEGLVARVEELKAALASAQRELAAAKKTAAESVSASSADVSMLKKQLNQTTALLSERDRELQTVRAEGFGGGGGGGDGGAANHSAAALAEAAARESCLREALEVEAAAAAEARAMVATLTALLEAGEGGEGAPIATQLELQNAKAVSAAAEQRARSAVAAVQELKEEYAHFEAIRARLMAELQQLRVASAQSTQEKEEALGQLAAASATAEGIAAERASLEAALQALQSKSDELSAELDSVQSVKTHLEEELESANGKLRESQQAIVNFTDTIEVLEEARNVLQNTSDQQKSCIERQEASLRSREESIVKMASPAAENADEEAQIHSLKLRLAEETVRQLRDEVSDLSRELASACADRDAFATSLTALQQSLLAERSRAPPTGADVFPASLWMALQAAITKLINEHDAVDIIPPNIVPTGNPKAPTQVHFGTKQVVLALVGNNHVAVQHGGGWMLFDEFVWRYGRTELRKLHCQLENAGAKAAPSHAQKVDLAEKRALLASSHDTATCGATHIHPHKSAICYGDFVANPLIADAVSHAATYSRAKKGSKGRSRKSSSMSPQPCDVYLQDFAMTDASSPTARLTRGPSPARTPTASLGMTRTLPASPQGPNLASTLEAAQAAARAASCAYLTHLSEKARLALAHKSLEAV